MRRFRYEDTGGVHEVEEKEIIKEYFPTWKQKMISIGKEDQVSYQNCVDDFCIIHYAHEVRTCKECFEDYVPITFDDGFCSDTCAEKFDEEITGDNDW